MSDLEAEATRLYGLPVEEFTAARDARVKELKADRELAKAVKALRRPTVAAWAVNLLVREREDLVRQVLAIGDSLREAQSSASGDALRELSKQRRQVVAAVVATTRQLAADEGVRLADASVEQVSATLQAALSDPDAADEVLAGCLSQPLTSTGVGSLGVAADPVPKPAKDTRAAVTDIRTKQVEPVDPKKRKKAERRVKQAEAVLAQAVKSHEEAQEEHRSAQAEHLHLESRLDELRRQVAELETEAEASATRVEELEGEVEETQELVSLAEEQLAEEREALAALE